jgi:hypothetical protein
VRVESWFVHRLCSPSVFGFACPNNTLGPVEGNVVVMLEQNCWNVLLSHLLSFTHFIYDSVTHMHMQVKLINISPPIDTLHACLLSICM